MNLEHKRDLVQRLQLLQFPHELPEGLEKRIDEGLDSLTLTAKQRYATYSALYSIDLSYRKESGFTLHAMEANVLQFGVLSHIRNDQVDTLALEERMKLINWDTFKKDTEELFKEKKLLAELKIMERTIPGAQQIVAQLSAKYLVGTSAESLLDNAAQVRKNYGVSHRFKMEEDSPEYSVDEARNLLLGRVVYKIMPETGKGAWTELENAASVTAIKQYAAHYNYDLKAVIRQLPLASPMDDKTINQVEYQLHNGHAVGLAAYRDGNAVKIDISADPKNRSLHLYDTEAGEAITMRELGVELTLPRKVDHYEVYYNRELLRQGNDYLSMLEYLRSVQDELGIGRLQGGHILVAVKDENPAHFIYQNKPDEVTTLTVASTVSHSDHIRIHIEPADIRTNFEEQLRGALQNFPYFTDSALKNITMEVMNEPIADMAQKLQTLLPVEDKTVIKEEPPTVKTKQRHPKPLRQKLE